MGFFKETQEVKLVFELAKQNSRAFKQPCLKPSLFLLSFSQINCVPKFIMECYNITDKTISDSIRSFEPTSSMVIGEIPNSKIMNKVIKKCNLMVNREEIPYVTINLLFKEILLALSAEHWFHKVLCTHSCTLYEMMQYVDKWEDCVGYEGDADISVHEVLKQNVLENAMFNFVYNKKAKTIKMPKSLSDCSTIDYTTLALNDEFDPMIGRERELKRIIDILCKRMKNNPVILGEPGIGKSALIEGLAKKIASGNVPSKLKDKVIYGISINSLLSGTKYRGDFEEKIQNIMKDVEKQENIILFIDEIHMIAGAGKTNEGAISFDNVIKPYLARGKITIIGATTLEEYRATIEKDAALERRFQMLILDEPTTNETIQILLGIKEKYEKFHNLEIGESEIKYIVQLAEKYIPERRFPDKAIDLMDEACAFTINNMSESSKLSKEAIKQVISGWKKLNVSEITTDQIAVISNLQKNIEQELFGQDEAISKILQVIKLATFGVVNFNRPKASFLLIGSTGVGKTYLAKLIAKHLNGDENSLVRLDMSEFKEKHTISKIIGSPPGYVGYDKTSGITEKVRRNPSSIILFDEVDKAHSDVLELLLQILDEGYITDSAMRKIDFKQSIIILTANSASYLDSKKKVGFALSGEDDNSVLINNLKKHIKPEILDRLDDVIVLNDLSEAALMKVIQKNITRLEDSFLDRNYKFSISDSVIDYFFEYSKHNKLGTRQIMNFVEKKLSNVIVEHILNGDIIQDLDYQIIYSDDNFRVLQCLGENSENNEHMLV